MNVRQTAIDYMKGTLVIGMVIAHALQLLTIPKGVFWLFSTTVNLITFSGFFFCFGYVFYLSYLTKSFPEVRQKMIKTAWKSLLAYYVAGFASFFLLSERFTGKPYPLTINELFQLLTFAKLAWVSEFLLTFFLITALVFVFFNSFKRLVDSPKAMLLLGVASLLTAIFLPPDFVVGRPLKLLIGSKTEFVFPVIQYLPPFLLGLYCSKYKVVWNWTIFGVSASGTALFVGYYLYNRAMPTEFLPSIYWLVGSYGILYVYFLAAKWLERRASSQQWLLSIGRNTLFYLLLSNFMLFSISNHLQTTSLIATAVGVTVILATGFLISLITQPAQSTGASQSKEKPLAEQPL